LPRSAKGLADERDHFGFASLQNASRGINPLVASALINGYEWVFIDTAPTTWLVVQEAIRAATMVVIPVRPGFFDLAAVRETVSTARDLNKPYAVVINAAPVKREDKEAPAVALSRAQFERLSVPVWSDRARSASARHSSDRSPPAPAPARPTAIPPANWRLRGCGQRSSARSTRSTAPRRVPGIRGAAPRDQYGRRVSEQRRTARGSLSACFHAGRLRRAGYCAKQ